MTQKSLECIEPGAPVAHVRVQEGAALAEYSLVKATVTDRSSELAAEDARSFVVQDGQLGETAMTMHFEHIDSETGEADVTIREIDRVSPALLQMVTQQAMREAGVHVAHFAPDLSEVPVSQLQQIGFHPQANTEALAFAA